MPNLTSRKTAGLSALRASRVNAVGKRSRPEESNANLGCGLSRAVLSGLLLRDNRTHPFVLNQHDHSSLLTAHRSLRL